MNYEVVFENKSLVRIKLNNVYFSIGKEAGILYQLINMDKSTDVVIPHIFPSGHQINHLSSAVVEDDMACNTNMVRGTFNTITISDGIAVGYAAFQGAEAKKIVWNDCPCIPSDCFYGSNVEVVTNISNVKEIKEGAFAHSSIASLNWPLECNIIPKECFRGCELLIKVVAPNVKEIGVYAFAESSINEIIWPEHCDTIPEGCFQDCQQLNKVIAPNVKEIKGYAFSNSNLTEFDWPTGCSRIPTWCFANSKLAIINHIDGVTSIEKLAFANTRLKVLDLSAANIGYLASKSLARLPNDCNLIPPYYYSGEDFEKAIGH